MPAERASVAAAADGAPEACPLEYPAKFDAARECVARGPAPRRGGEQGRAARTPLRGIAHAMLERARRNFARGVLSGRLRHTRRARAHNTRSCCALRRSALWNQMFLQPSAFACRAAGQRGGSVPRSCVARWGQSWARRPGAERRRRGARGRGAIRALPCPSPVRRGCSTLAAPACAA